MNSILMAAIRKEAKTELAVIAEKKARRKDRKDKKESLSKLAKWVNQTAASIPTPSTVNIVRYDNDSHPTLAKLIAISNEYQSVKTGQMRTKLAVERGVDVDTLQNTHSVAYYKAMLGLLKGYMNGPEYRVILDQPNQRTGIWADCEPDVFVEKFRKLHDPRLLNDELNYADKFGPYFSLPYPELVGKVNALFEPLESKFTEGIITTLTQIGSDIANDFVEAIGAPSVALSFDDAVKNVKKGKNGGAPFFTRQWSEDGNEELASYYSSKAERVFYTDEDFDLPAILFKRVDCNKDKPKMRPVEAPEGAVKFLDTMFQVPLTTMFKQYTATYGYSESM